MKNHKSSSYGVTGCSVPGLRNVRAIVLLPTLEGTMRIKSGRRSRQAEQNMTARNARRLGAKRPAKFRWALPAAFSVLAVGAALAAPAVASASVYQSPVVG